MKRATRITVRQPPRDSSRHRGPNTRDVCRGDVVLAKLQEAGNGLWFMYGLAASVPNTASRPDHFDAVRDEALAACRLWLRGKQAEERKVSG